jgi:hypothetical protein
MKYYKGVITVQSSGPIGREPEMVQITPNNALVELMRKRIHKLIYEEKVPNQDIIVLTPKSKNNSVLKAGTKFGNFSLTWEEPTGNEIECCTIHAFKGLERPIVMMVELDGYIQEEVNALSYIGTSRASNHLIVFSYLSLS